jgi:hypothetical protein
MCMCLPARALLMSACAKGTEWCALSKGRTLAAEAANFADTGQHSAQRTQAARHARAQHIAFL